MGGWSVPWGKHPLPPKRFSWLPLDAAGAILVQLLLLELHSSGLVYLRQDCTACCGLSQLKWPHLSLLCGSSSFLKNHKVSFIKLQFPKFLGCKVMTSKQAWQTKLALQSELEQKRLQRCEIRVSSQCKNSCAFIQIPSEEDGITFWISSMTSSSATRTPVLISLHCVLYLSCLPFKRLGGLGLGLYLKFWIFVLNVHTNFPSDVSELKGDLVLCRFSFYIIKLGWGAELEI